MCSAGLLPTTHEFLQAAIKWPENESLTLNTYDGCGTLLYMRKFNSIKVISAKQVFDYASSDVAAIEYIIKFKTTTTKGPK